MPARTGHFTPELFRFLKALARHNDRDWFQANKARYEDHVRGPFLHFIADFGVRLERFAPHLVADPRPSGGSLFRIHRDTRFAKDKSPYKTHAGAQFRHAAGKDVHAPGFYLHLGVDGVMAGAGIWHPDGPALKRIREAIVADPARWKKVFTGKAMRELGPLKGESLKRPPRGFDPDHAFVEDLKRKDFYTMVELKPADACEPDFLNQYVKLSRAAKPLMAFLCDALDLEW
ncbi:MAG: DUF2461 domain-containing protein [bacterium]|nr:DUF2461 domain-containing protein [bacterium]